MYKTNFTRLILSIGMGLFLLSCNNQVDNSISEAIKEVKDGQAVILKKISTLEKTVSNLALANKSQPSKKNEPPKSDPNKVYNIPIGDSFSKGPKDAAVTLIEWTDFQ